MPIHSSLTFANCESEIALLNWPGVLWQIYYPHSGQFYNCTLYFNPSTGPEWQIKYSTAVDNHRRQSSASVTTLRKENMTLKDMLNLCSCSDHDETALECWTCRNEKVLKDALHSFMHKYQLQQDDAINLLSLRRNFEQFMASGKSRARTDGRGWSLIQEIKVLPTVTASTSGEGAWREGWGC
jgi:hypothetical protein